MKYYVLHYPKRPERKIRLLEQFSERGIKDVTWIEGFNKDDHFVQWIKTRTQSPMPLGQVASSVKHYLIMRDIVENNIPEAIIFEDDVIIHPEFDKLKMFPRDIGFMRLGAGVHILAKEWENVKPSADVIMKIENPGGCEAYWVTNDFAKSFSESSNFDYSIDMAQMGFLQSLLLVCYVCHQTSLFTDDSTTESCSGNWIEYVQNFPKKQKYNFSELVDEYRSKITIMYHPKDNDQRTSYIPHDLS